LRVFGVEGGRRVEERKEGGEKCGGLASFIKETREENRFVSSGGEYALGPGKGESGSINASRETGIAGERESAGEKRGKKNGPDQKTTCRGGGRGGIIPPAQGHGRNFTKKG